MFLPTFHALKHFFDFTCEKIENHIGAIVMSDKKTFAMERLLEHKRCVTNFDVEVSITLITMRYDFQVKTDCTL
jgi:hypothetical protein